MGKPPGAAPASGGPEKGVKGQDAGYAKGKPKSKHGHGGMQGQDADYAKGKLKGKDNHGGGGGADGAKSSARKGSEGKTGHEGGKESKGSWFQGDMPARAQGLALAFGGPSPTPGPRKPRSGGRASRIETRASAEASMPLQSLKVARFHPFLFGCRDLIGQHFNFSLKHL